MVPEVDLPITVSLAKATLRLMFNESPSVPAKAETQHLRRTGCPLSRA
jgi:hypothetical protein